MIEGNTPWNVRDILDLVNKQKNQTISFFKKISKLAQQFITGCLTYEENNILGWEQVFTHPLFENAFERQPNKEKQQQSQPQAQNPQLYQYKEQKYILSIFSNSKFEQNKFFNIKTIKNIFFRHPNSNKPLSSRPKYRQNQHLLLVPADSLKSWESEFIESQHEEKINFLKSRLRDQNADNNSIEFRYQAEVWPLKQS